jgi:transposase
MPRRSPPPSRCWTGCKKTVAEPERPDLERLHLVYVDECEVHTHPYLVKVWRQKGRPMKIPAAGEDQKFTVFGGVDYATGQILWQTSGGKGEAAFAAFLDHLAQTLPANEPVVVVLDNVGYHKSHALHVQWQRLADRLQPFFLPAYAPQLNLIERLWHYLKAKLACHCWWNDLDRLKQATATLLDALEVHFHATDRPEFH